MPKGVRVRVPPRAFLYEIIRIHTMLSKKPSNIIFKWTTELAYAVGLLVTDGCLSNDGRHIILRSIDREQLENFKKCLHLKNKLGIARIQFGSVKFYRWLESIGLFSNKTYTIGAIKIPDIFFRDFLRGHLDGDGSVTVYDDSYNSRINKSYVYIRFFIRFISASHVHIEWLRKKINILCGVKGDLFEIKPRDSKHVSVWQIKYMKKESLKLLNFLYYSPNVICLSRKRDKALDAVKRMSQIKRKKYTWKAIYSLPSHIPNTL